MSATSFQRRIADRRLEEKGMEQIYLTGLLLFVLFLLLGGGVWIGLSLLGVALFAMELFTTRPAGDAMITTIWTASSSWTLTALPLFIWMGEILFRTRLSEDMFRGLSPWMTGLPGRLLHTNIVGSAIFAAISGSSAATCFTIGKMTIPELRRRAGPWPSACTRAAFSSRRPADRGRAGLDLCRHRDRDRGGGAGGRGSAGPGARAAGDHARELLGQPHGRHANLGDDRPHSHGRLLPLSLAPRASPACRRTWPRTSRPWTSRPWH